MHPTQRSFADAARVFIVAMSSEDVVERYPNIRGLPIGLDVFVVLSETGAPLLITDTRAEALRQVETNPRVVLAKLN